MSLDISAIHLIGVLMLLGGALATWVTPRLEKALGTATLLLSLLPLAVGAHHSGQGGGLRQDFLIIATITLAATLLAMPRMPLYKRMTARLLLGHAGTVLFLTQTAPLAMGAGWIVSLLPVFLPFETTLRGEENPLPRSFRMAQLAGCLFLMVGLVGQGGELKPLPDAASTLQVAAQLALVLGAFLRLGLFPFHIFHISWSEKGPLPLIMSLSAAPLGVILLMEKAESLAAQGASHGASPLTWFLALSLGIYGILSLTQRGLRHWTACVQMFLWTLALLLVIQGGDEAPYGARLLLCLATLGGAGMTYLLWVREIRLGREDTVPPGGLADVMPRLSGTLLLVGLALVGLPFTLGYVSEDVWLHLSHHFSGPMASLIVVAYVFLGIGFYRLYSHWILGSASLPPTTDLVLREKLALLFFLVPLLVLGVIPSLVFGT